LCELDERNIYHRAALERICGHCVAPESVVITRTADQDLALIPLNKKEVLDAVKFHLENKRKTNIERMDNNDLVYVFPSCDVQGIELYVKLKLLKGEGNVQKMLIISAHPPRRW